MRTLLNSGTTNGLKDLLRQLRITIVDYKLNSSDTSSTGSITLCNQRVMPWSEIGIILIEGAKIGWLIEATKESDYLCKQEGATNIRKGATQVIAQGAFTHTSGSSSGSCLEQISIYHSCEPLTLICEVWECDSRLEHLLSLTACLLQLAAVHTSRLLC